MKEKTFYYTGNDEVLMGNRVQIVERGFYSKPDGNWFETGKGPL